MATSYTGLRVQDTYNAIIKIGDNTTISATAKLLSDGLGNDSPLYLSGTRLGIGITPTYQFHTSGNAKIGGNLIISGNLTVNGTLTYLNVEDLSVEDPIIKLAKDNTSNTLDIGLFGKYVSTGTKYKGFFNDASDNKFKLFIGTTVEPTTTVNTSASGYTKGDLVIGGLEATTGTFSDNVLISGYLDLTSFLYTRNTLRVLNAAGNGWHDWAVRSNGKYNLDVNNITATLISGTTGNFSSNVNINGNLQVDGTIKDSSDDAGTSGQLLSSTGTGTNWIDFEADVAKRIDVTVKNVSGGSLAKGIVVHASPSASPPSGNVIEVIAADANVAASMPAIGVLNETIADQAEGEAVMFGALSGVDTSSFTSGDELYVSETAGAFTATKPTAFTSQVQKIAIVLKVHASNGSIKVFGAGRANDVPNRVDRDMNFTDGSKLLFGNDSDLEMYHDGTDGYIDNINGELIIQNNSNDKKIIFKSDNGIGDIAEYFRVDGNINRNIISVTTQLNDDVLLIFGSGAGRPSIKYNSTATQLYISGESKFLNDLYSDGSGTFLGDMFIGATGTTPKVDMLFLTNSNGPKWDTRAFIGKSDDLPGGAGEYPTYEPAGSYGIQFQSNSDGAFFGIEDYGNNQFRPVINWGDDNADTPFRFKFKGSPIVTIDYLGNITAPEIITTSTNPSKFTSGGIRAKYLAIFDGASTQTGGLYMEKTITGAGTSTNTVLFAEGGNNIQFATNGSTTPKMVINTDGKVAINEDNPLAKLTVNQDSLVDTEGIFVQSGGDPGNGGVAIFKSANLVGSISALGSNSNLSFMTNSGATRMFIDNDGKIGMGLTNPNALLHIKGTGDAIRVESTNTGAGGAQIDLLHFTTSPADNDTFGLINMGGYYSGTSSVYGTSIKSIWTDVSARNADLTFSTNNSGTLTEKMRLDSSGKVTITGYTDTISTYGSAYNQQLYNAPSFSQGVWQVAGVSKALVGAGSAGMIINTAGNATAPIIFSTGSATSTRMVINSSGNIGISETSPFAKLHIKSSDTGVTAPSAQGNLLVLEDAENGLSILSSTAGAGYINFGDSDDNDIGMIIYGHSSNSMDFWTNAGKRMTIDSSGYVNINQKQNSGLNYDLLINIGTSPNGKIGYQTQSQLAANLAVNANSNWVKTGNNIYNTNSANVGIGTTTIPSDHILQISNDGQAYARFALTNSQTGNASGDGLIFQMENLNSIIKNQENGTLGFGTNGRETDILIDSSGNVGIGGTTITDSNLLNLQGSSVTKNIGVVFNDTNTSKIFGIQNGGSALKIFDYTASAERIRVNSVGDVLIGATSKYNGYPSTFVTQTLASSSGDVCPILELVGNRSAAAGNQNAMIQFFNKTSTAVEVCRISSVQGSSTNSGELTFNTTHAGSGAEKVRIDSLGRVGIGTNNPSRELHVENASDHAIISAVSGTSNISGLVLGDTADDDRGGILYNNSSDYLYFQANGSERMRISSTGKVGINTTTGLAKLVVNQNSYADTEGIWVQSGNDPGEGGVAIFKSANKVGSISALGGNSNLSFMTSSSTTRMFINSVGNIGINDTTPSYKLDVNGDIRATSDVIAFSDIRVKENIVTIDNALNKINKLRGVTYTRKDKTDKSTKIGVIAQEVLKVLPEVVSKDDEGMYSVAYGNLAGVFIEAIKELENRIKELENKPCNCNCK